MKKYILLSISLYLLATGQSFADSIDLAKQSGDSDISSSFTHFIGPKEISTKTILEKRFKPIKSEEFNFGYTHDVIWLKLNLTNSSNKRIKKILYFDTTLTGVLNLYGIENGKTKYLQQTGSSLPLDKRAVPSSYGAFQISLAPLERKELLFERYSHHRLDSHVFVIDENEFEKIESKKMALIHLYIGSLFSLFIYNVFLFIYSNEKTYLHYSLCIFFMGSLVLNFLGEWDNFFIFENFTFSHYLIISSSLAVISLTHFSEGFLRVGEYLPSFCRYFKITKFTALAIIILFISPFQHLIASFLGNIIDIIVACTVLLLIISGFRIYFKGFIMAKFFLLSWGALFIGILSLLSVYAGILTKNQFSTYGLLWGNICEMLIISIGLAYKISILDQEKKIAEFNALRKDLYERLVKVLLHDISNPLTVVLHYTSVLRKKLKDTENSPTIENLHKSTNNIQNVIMSIRSQYSSSINSNELAVDKIDVKKALEECVFFYENKLEAKKLTVEYDIDDDAVHVMAHRETIINSVFGNIISNAIKFSHHSSIVKIQTITEGNKVIVKISDQGIGIAEEDINTFNDTGKIGHTEGTDSEPGLGYGITLISSYMKYFKGEVNITSRKESNDQSGETTFLLTFLRAI